MYKKLNEDPKYKKLQDKYRALDFIDEESYKKIHTKHLVPLNIVIDSDLFELEIQKYHGDFTYWGIGREKNEGRIRHGLGLTDLNEPLPFDPPSNPITTPLDKWMYKYPDYPLFDADFSKINSYFKGLNSLEEYLKLFYNYHMRSCILWWNGGHGFVPHIDTDVPAPQIRLWGTNDPEHYVFNFWNGKEYVREENIERGRLYLCDTSIMHEAHSTAKNVYTFFFSLHPDSYDLVKEHIL